MTSREKILARVVQNQPAMIPLPNMLSGQLTETSTVDLFKSVFQTIGGTIIELDTLEEIAHYLTANFTDRGRIISTLPELSGVTEPAWENQNPHDFENIDLAIIKSHFGVAENAALWITEELMQQRVIPFICQQLAVVVSKKDIVPDMHRAYEIIGNSEYGFGTFIAGPSKTADIEQSLVLGAHGPKSMIIFLVP
ncbi:MAG: LUD domain-containing protein [Bacteroidota bacterium]